jgi:hypothetical protein
MRFTEGSTSDTTFVSLTLRNEISHTSCEFLIAFS